MLSRAQRRDSILGPNRYLSVSRERAVSTGVESSTSMSSW